MSNLPPDEKAAKNRYKDVRRAIDLHIAKVAGREFHYHRSMQPMNPPPREFVHLKPEKGEDPADAIIPYLPAQEVYLLAAKMHYLELKGDHVSVGRDPVSRY